MTVMDLFALLGGLGLFLFGMKLMGDGLEKAAGQRLKRVLELVTGNRLLAVLAGILITAVIQSSSATTVMVVGFVNGGLLSLTQAVGVIMGANIGTTVTSLMLSAKLDFSVLLAFAGLVLSLPKRESLRQAGVVCMGLAILFTGMNIMSDAMVPLRQWDGFRTLISSVSHPLPGVLVGAGMTAILQSSSASVGILQALAAQGLIPLSTGLYILFGQNIGTCVTAMIASATANATAKRAAMVHLLFNVFGTLFFLALTLWLPLADWIAAFAPDNLRLQIALIHVVFNVTTTLFLLPFARLLERAASLLVPSREQAPEKQGLIYFDPCLLATPSIAAHQLFREVQRMSRLALANYRASVSAFFQWDPESIPSVSSTEEMLDELNRLITETLVDVNAAGLTDHDSRLVGALFHVVNDLERIGDHATNLLECAQARQQDEILFSDASLAELDSLCREVDIILTSSLAGQNVEVQEEVIDSRTASLRDAHVARLQNRECSPLASVVYLDMLTNLERVADHANNIGALMTGRALLN